MRIGHILNSGQTTFSFEFFPPKDEEGMEQLFSTLKVLRPLEPSFVSVTFGAGGNTRVHTVELVKRIKHEVGLEPMAHLTCVGMTRDEIGETLQQLQDAGIENILALRGDPPKGQSEFVVTQGGFAHAYELVQFIRGNFKFSIGVAGYPEGHPETPDWTQDMAYLKQKVDAGADFVISQLFFDNRYFYRFQDHAIREGIRIPLIPGIMPILNIRQIQRFAQMCGATIPAELNRKLEAVEDDPEAVRHIGMFHATLQCQDLLAHGALGIHFYTLNRSTATRAIFQMLKTGID